MSVPESSWQIGNVATNMEPHRPKQAVESVWSLSKVIPKRLWRRVVGRVHGTRTMLIENTDRMQNIVRAESDRIICCITN